MSCDPGRSGDVSDCIPARSRRQYPGWPCFLRCFLRLVDHLVDSLVLQGRIEGLRPGIRPAHPGSSHRGASAVSPQVPGGGVLAAAARRRWRRVLAAGLRGLAGPGSARAVRTASGLTSALADSGWSFPIRFHPHRPRTVLFPPLSEKHQAPQAWSGCFPDLACAGGGRGRRGRGAGR